MIRDRLLGTWELVSFAQQRPDGRVERTMGEDARGYLIYGADGIMAVQIMRRDRPPLPGSSAAEASEPELRAALEGCIAYCGPYEVDEAAGTVTHHLTCHLVPNRVGDAWVRWYTLEEPLLTLRTAPPSGEPGVPAAGVIWRRLSTKTGQ